LAQCASVLATARLFYDFALAKLVSRFYYPEKKGSAREMTRVEPEGRSSGEVGWTFLTNHAHVLLCIAQDPEARMRDMAEQVGITERAVQRIISELEEGGYLLRVKDGRRNRYEVRGDRPLRHPIERHQKVAALLALVRPAGEEARPPGEGRPRTPVRRQRSE
jgi:DNA-binding transcriptional ArsR family regulator